MALSRGTLSVASPARDHDAIETAICKAWNKLLGEAGRLTSVTSYPWIMQSVRN
jgi:hypothetical protein